MRLRALPLLTVALVLTACGGGGGGSVTVASSAASSDSFDKDLCSEFEASDGPSEKLLAGLPDRFDEATAAIKDFGTAMDAMGDNDETSIDGIAKLLTTKGIDAELKDLAAFAEKQCGESDGSKTIAALAMAAETAGAKKDTAYCDALEQQFADDGSGSDSSTADNLAALAKLAPDSHQAAIEVLSNLDQATEEAAQTEAFGALMGVGVYAEKQCGIKDALTQMLLGAMFMGAGSDSSSGSDAGSGSSIPDIDPSSYPDADATPVNATVPPESGLTFEVAQADLDGDGQYLASMVVPVGWTAENNFDVTYSPPSDAAASMFTEIGAGAGCDGTCSATNWEERLRGNDGKIGQFISSHPSAAEEPIAGSAGAILSDTTDGVYGLVVRWDDRADKYFSCEVRLDDDQADLLSTFLTACELSRPAWFPVAASS